MLGPISKPNVVVVSPEGGVMEKRACEVAIPWDCCIEAPTSKAKEKGVLQPSLISHFLILAIHSLTLKHTSSELAPPC